MDVPQPLHVAGTAGVPRPPPYLAPDVPEDLQVQSEQHVWFEFVNCDGSTAVPIRLSNFDVGSDDIDGRLLYRSGLEGWTPMRQVLASRSSGGSHSSEVTRSSEVRAGSAATEGSERHSLSSSSGAGRGSAASAAAASSTVMDVRHGVHVTSDPLSGGLAGLPEGWVGVVPDGCSPAVRRDGELPPQLRPAAARPGVVLREGPIVGVPFNVCRWRPHFGQPLELCETTEVNGYQLPTLLLHLMRQLRVNGGLLEEGVFRVPADAATCDALRASLNNAPGALELIGSSTDPHVLATLIKMWFRQLPTRLLSGATATDFAACTTGAEAMALLRDFPPALLGLFLWILEVMADVAQHQHSNRMTERAIAIVVAPNLYDDLPAGAPSCPGHT